MLLRFVCWKIDLPENRTYPFQRGARCPAYRHPGWDSPLLGTPMEIGLRRDSGMVLGSVIEVTSMR